MGTVSHPISTWAGNMSAIMLACFFILTGMSTSALEMEMEMFSPDQGNGKAAERRHLCHLLCSSLSARNILLVL